MRIPVVFFTLFALGMVNGCVSQTTYDAVVQEGLTTRSAGASDGGTTETCCPGAALTCAGRKSCQAHPRSSRRRLDGQYYGVARFPLAVRLLLGLLSSQALFL
jgi:hypothetical protein